MDLNSLTLGGKTYDSFPDTNARERLNKVEYQPVTTDLAYEHKDLPEGEKTVTVNGDGIFGNKAYVVSSEDIIPRTTFNRSFPYNGITVTKNDKTYHVDGTTSVDYTGVVFSKTSTDTLVEIDKDISGKNFKLISFVSQYPDGKMSGVVEFRDSNKNKVQVLKSNGTLANSISTYIGSDVGYRETNFSIPDNVEIKYAIFTITFRSNYAFNHDFQFYIAEADNIQTVTLEGPTATITDTEVTNIFTAPYQSTTETKVSIADYINYKANNAKGDTATYLTPEAFGAVGDGYTDDIEAITACLTMANTTN